MKRPTSIYLLVLLVGAAGLWTVLKLGSHLQASADLGGSWRIESGPLGPGADGPESLGEGFIIDQSGQFLRVRFASGRRLDFRARTMPRGQIGEQPVELELVADPWELKGSISRTPEGALIGSFRLSGPERARFIAYRDVPTTQDPSPIEPTLPTDAPAPPTQISSAAPLTQPAAGLLPLDPIRPPAEGASPTQVSSPLEPTVP